MADWENLTEAQHAELNDFSFDEERAYHRLVRDGMDHDNAIQAARNLDREAQAARQCVHCAGLDGYHVYRDCPGVS